MMSNKRDPDLDSPIFSMKMQSEKSVFLLIIVTTRYCNHVNNGRTMRKKLTRTKCLNINVPWRAERTKTKRLDSS